MHRCYIAFGILLILPIVDFAFAAPVPVQQKPQAGVHAVHTRTKLGKRGFDGFDELSIIFGHPESHFPAKPEKPPATRPSSSSQPSGPADVSTNVEQPIPSIPEEPSQVASTSHAPPIPGDDELDRVWLDIYGHRFFDESLAAPPLWSSPTSGFAHDWMGAKQPVPSIPNEPSQVASTSHAPPIPGNHELDKVWLDLYGHRVFDESLAAPPLWSSPTSGSAHDWMGVEQPVPSIPNEQSQVASPGHAPPIASDDELDRVWLDLYGHRFFDESSAAPSAWSSPTSESAHDYMGVEQ